MHADALSPLSKPSIPPQTYMLTRHPCYPMVAAHTGNASADRQQALLTRLTCHTMVAAHTRSVSLHHQLPRLVQPCPALARGVGTTQRPGCHVGAVGTALWVWQAGVAMLELLVALPYVCGRPEEGQKGIKVDTRKGKEGKR